MDEKSPTSQEVLEAEALSRALEGDGSASDIPDDALAAASLLRYSQDGGDLAEDRKQALRAEIIGYAEEMAAKRTTERAKHSWLRPIGALVGGFAAAGFAIFLVVTPSNAPQEAGPGIPLPSSQLLEAQLSAAEGDPQGFEQLSNEMRVYRGELYATLSDRYRGGQ